uniref:Legume lectin domain-containing protein n=1 Tax=Oryza barthii TaxID=65489 RepID=A0A0D3HAU3_9ORYZ
MTIGLPVREGVSSAKLTLIVACFLLPFLVEAESRAPAPLSFSFDFSNSASYRLEDLRFEGDASEPSNKLVDLTCNEFAETIHKCKGRMSYAHAVKFYDATTGEAASFSTRFTFAIAIRSDNSNPTDTKGDGLAFFLAAYPSTIPSNSDGGNLGLLATNHSKANGTDRFIAVEFDTYNNFWDPNKTYDHMGVDISAIESANTTSLPSYSLNGTMTASISFNSSTRMLLANLHFDDHPSFQPAEVSAILPDPVTLLPQEVSVGFSAATGGSGSELHQILSWSFNSTLGLALNSNSTADPPPPPLNSNSIADPPPPPLNSNSTANPRRVRRKE